MTAVAVVAAGCRDTIVIGTGGVRNGNVRADGMMIRCL